MASTYFFFFLTSSLLHSAVEHVSIYWNIGISNDDTKEIIRIHGEKLSLSYNEIEKMYGVSLAGKFSRCSVALFTANFVNIGRFCIWYKQSIVVLRNYLLLQL